MIALTIAGSDSGGGAGIQADVKTFQELGVFATTVITALTAQNTLGVHSIFPSTVQFVEAQLKAVLEDFNIKAIKTGMLLNSEIIESVAATLLNSDLPVIVDPVMIAKGGASLLQQDAIHALKSKLLPLATICTPNIQEAEVLSGRAIKTQQQLYQAAQDILSYGVKCVVMKGGHLPGDKAVDTVFIKGEIPFYVETNRYQTKHTHGTGCTFSAAITAEIAKGTPLKQAIVEAKKFVQLAISNPLNIGHGFGPTNHFAYRQLGGRCNVNVVESR